jgi:hypothetical protein
MANGRNIKGNDEMISKKRANQIVAKIPSDAVLVTIAKATAILGKGYSYSSILRRIETGEWKEGVHWIDDSTLSARKRSIKINLTAVNEFRAIPKAFRA